MAEGEPEASLIESSLRNVSLDTDESLRSECVDAMMQKTQILEEDEAKISRVRRLFEKVYDAGALTSCLLTYLRGQSRLSIFVDCDSLFVAEATGGRLIVDHDGVEKDGSRLHSFADLREMEVYLGALEVEYFGEEFTVGLLAMSLAQVAVCIAFGNEGRPYATEQAKGRFERIFQEAEEKLGGGAELDVHIHGALCYEDPLAREIYLISTAPRMIAEYVTDDGASLLRRQLPSLLDYYESHVVSALLNE